MLHRRWVVAGNNGQRKQHEIKIDRREQRHGIDAKMMMMMTRVTATFSQFAFVLFCVFVHSFALAYAFVHIVWTVNARKWIIATI